MPSIFISYRRADSSPYAGRLYDRLRSHFGDSDVFMDLETLEPGEEFAKVIVDRAGAAQILIALIGPSWVTQRTADGMRRLDDPADLVVREIETALASGARVIPVLTGKATMPTRADLPARIAALADRNAIELSDQRFREDVDRLIKAIVRTTPAGKRRTLMQAGAAAVGAVVIAGAIGWWNLRPGETPPVFAPAPQPQPVTTPVPAPVAGGAVASVTPTWESIRALPVIYAESFDPATVLDIWKPEAPPRAPWTEELKDGRYCAVNTTSDTGVHFIHVSVDNNDLRDAPVFVRVQAEASPPTSFAGAGLMVRFDTEDRTYYAYVLSPTGDITLWRRGKDGLSKLYSATAPRVTPGKPTTIGIAARASRFFLFVDESLAATVDDDALKQGRVGTIAMSKGRYCFDDFTVRAAR